MNSNEENLIEFQKLIGYTFKNKELLIQSLTTPLLANEIGRPSYDYLEILGDAVIKLIFILKLKEKGIQESGKITQIKSTLESDKTFIKIATRMDLMKFIYKTEKQGFEFPKRPPTLMVIWLDDTLRKIALKTSLNLRKKGFVVISEVRGRKLSSALDYANKMDVTAAILFGKKEVEKGKIAIKDMKTGEQEEYPMDQIPQILYKKYFSWIHDTKK